MELDRGVGFCFSKHLNDWELDNVEAFLSRLQGMSMNSVEVKVLWMDSRKDKLSIKSLYAALGMGTKLVFSHGK